MPPRSPETPVPQAIVDVQGLDQALRLASPFRFVGRPVQITFLVANTKTEVLHQCGEIPDGFQIVRGNGASVIDEPATPWTKDLAYLRSTVATQVIGYFVKLREDPINVAP